MTELSMMTWAFSTNVGTTAFGLSFKLSFFRCSPASTLTTLLCHSSLFSTRTRRIFWLHVEYDGCNSSSILQFKSEALPLMVSKKTAKPTYIAYELAAHLLRLTLDAALTAASGFNLGSALRLVKLRDFMHLLTPLLYAARVGSSPRHTRGPARRSIHAHVEIFSGVWIWYTDSREEFPACRYVSNTSTPSLIELRYYILRD
jgi:hypothetical protein